jgi:hypothetical protein
MPVAEARIDVIELRSLNQGEHDGCPLPAAVGSCEQPCLAAEGNSAQCPLGSVVAQANPLVALEDVIHGLGDLVVSRELAPLTPHPVEKVVDNGAISLRRTASRSSGGCPLIARSAAKMTSIRLSASNSMGEIVGCF